MQKLLLSFIIVIFANSFCLAQIQYYDIDPDKAIQKSDAFALHIAKHKDSVVYGEDGSFVIWNYDPGILLVTYSGCEVQADGVYPSLLDSNDKIDSSATWRSAQYSSLYNGSVGHWMNAVDKYMAIRVMQGGKWHYGWVRLDVNATGDGATVKDYAYNLTGDASIRAGQRSTVGIGNIPYEDDVNINISNGVATVKNIKHRCIIMLSDMSGRVIKKAEVINDYEIKLHSYRPGIYIISVASEITDVVKTQKIYVQ